MKELQVTQISELVQYKAGAVIAFPPFAEGQPFVARLKRPSMLVLIKSGKIPNSLLGQAQNLFAGNQANPDEENSMNDLFEIMDILAEASFIEPTYKELKDNGIELTDQQLFFLFNYSQQGVKALESFRVDAEDTGNNINGKDVQSQA